MGRFGDRWSTLQPTPEEHRLRQSVIVVKRELGLAAQEVAEIGVRDGHHAESLLSTFPNARVTLVDPYVEYGEDGYFYSQNRQDDASRQAIARLSRWRDRTLWVRYPSVEGCRLFADASFDFVYIDADHRYEFVRDDITAWYPKVKPGRFLGGHDYHPAWPGVMQAVKEFVHREQLVLDACGDWLVQKPELP